MSIVQSLFRKQTLNIKVCFDTSFVQSLFRHVSKQILNFKVCFNTSFVYGPFRRVLCEGDIDKRPFTSTSCSDSWSLFRVGFIMACSESVSSDSNWSV